MINLSKYLARSRHGRSLPAALAFLLLAGSLVALQALAADTRRVEGLDFDAIAVLGSVAVEIEQGPATVLKMRGSAEDLDRGPFHLRGDRLVLGANPQHRRHDFSDVKFRVELPRLRLLQLQGSGDVYLRPFDLRAADGDLRVSLDGTGDIRIYGITARILKMKVKGSGDIRAVDVEVDGVEAVVAGSGDLYLKHLAAAEGSFVVTGSGDIAVVESGTVERLELNIVGSGDIDLRAVEARSAEVNVVGSGAAGLGRVRESVNCSILGSGDVRFDGDPRVESVQLGSGDCRSRDD